MSEGYYSVSSNGSESSFRPSQRNDGGHNSKMKEVRYRAYRQLGWIGTNGANRNTRCKCLFRLGRFLNPMSRLCLPRSATVDGIHIHCAIGNVIELTWENNRGKEDPYFDDERKLFFGSLAFDCISLIVRQCRALGVNMEPSPNDFLLVAILNFIFDIFFPSVDEAIESAFFFHASIECDFKL